MSLGVWLLRLEKSLTRTFESGLVNSAIAFDDVNLTSSAVGERDNLPCALILAHPREVQRWKASTKMTVWLEVMAKLSGSALLLSAFHPCSKIADPPFIE
jgi:hypothetical protein